MIPIENPNETHELGTLATRIIRTAGGIGLLGALASIVLLFVGEGGAERFFTSYLWAFVYFLSLSLGALFFTLIHHLTRAGWSVAVRRLAEFTASNLWLMAILAVPVIVGMRDLFPWTDAAVVAESELLQGKQAYLNTPFFIVRLGIYFGVWLLISRYFLRQSLAQDAEGDFHRSVRMERLSAPAMVLYALTVTFAAFDLIMTRDPTWYSTIFGVYYFAGSYLGSVAFLIVMTYYLQRNGRLTSSVTIEHYHDLGKWVFGFIVFWAYIAFSQYMLVWYGNIPEETEWYARRQEGAWAVWSLILLFGHFVLPFLALISRYPKRHKRILVTAAVYMLLMHAVDLYWLVMPELSPEGPPLGLVDLAVFLGMGGIYVAVLAARMRGASIIPRRDPRLEESLVFENF